MKTIHLATSTLTGDKGIYYALGVSREDARQLASVLKQSAHDKEELLVIVDNTEWLIRFGSEVGRFLINGERLEFFSNRVDLEKIASHVEFLAENEDEKCMNHFHFEPVYLSRVGEFEDFVIERKDPVGTYPTIDIAVFISDEATITEATILKALAPAISEESWRRVDGRLYATAPIGDTEKTNVLFFSVESSSVSMYCLVFDEDAIVLLHRRLKQDIFTLIEPYVKHMTRIDSATMVGVGFEISIPRSFRDEDLKDAGICIAYMRDEISAIWSEKQLTELVGHYR